jgi:RNA-binding protein 8A
LIEFETYKEAKGAIEASNGSELLGQIIQTDFAFIRGAVESRSIQQVTKRYPKLFLLNRV